MAIDCEGVALGRFGKLCTIQIATDDSVFIFDTLTNGIVDVLGQLFEDSNILKIMHDCREDSSALFHNFGVKLSNVYDTQVASLMLQEYSQIPNKAYQSGLDELMKTYLKYSPIKKELISQKMSTDPHVWFYRPFSQDLIEYAVVDVTHLGALRSILNENLTTSLSHNQQLIKLLPNGTNMDLNVVDRTKTLYLPYRDMNASLKKGGVDKRGLKISGMVVSVSDDAIYFKLNSERTGVVSNSQHISSDFKGAKVGDVYDLITLNCVPTQKIVYIRKWDSSRDEFAKRVELKREEQWATWRSVKQERRNMKST